jgi:electron transfer flavoprotein beta subunit
MRLAVMIKQVPATDTVKIDPEKGTMIREGLEMEINPLDLHALEAAVTWRDRLGGEAEVVVFSMGPPSAIKAIRSALAFGCDRGFLISDRLFGGSDTLATARALAAALEKEGPFDLVLCGERATDGETGQVGPALGHLMKASVVTYVNEITEIAEGRITLRRAVEGGSQVVRAALPAQLSVVKELNRPRLLTLRRKQAVREREIPVLTAADLGLPVEWCGLKGSPTQVVSVKYPELVRSCEMIHVGADLEKAVTDLADILRKEVAAHEG